jgi:APA family basic amino acid/polyamine antiporter
MPNGFSGVTSAAALILFAYIGLDAVSTSGEEVKRPARDLPLAIIASLAITTVLCCVVAVAATGAYPWQKLNGAEFPLATVLSDGVGTSWGSGLISVGALIAITSAVLTILYGQTRVMYSMSRDGLVPQAFSWVCRRQTPALATAIFGILIAVLAATVPLEIIFELVNIGTLFAFVIVNVGVIVLRRTRPDLKRGFRVPGVPVVPHHRRAAVLLPDEAADHRDLASVHPVAARGPDDLLLLRTPELAAAARRDGRHRGELSPPRLSARRAGTMVR